MRSQTKLGKNITAILKDLFSEYKFKVVFQEYHAEHFGNEIIEYEFENFLMFMIKDRGYLSIDLASKNSPDNHIPLPNLLESIGVAKMADLISNDFQSIKKQLEFFSQNTSEILKVLKQPN